MSKVWKPIGCFNTTEFAFEGYLNKICIGKGDNDMAGQKYAVDVSIGPIIFAETRLSLKHFTQDKDALEEGAAYIFKIRTRTDEFTEMQNIMLVSAEKLDREPVKGLKTKVNGRMRKFYDTESELTLVDFECESDNKLGKETYRCRTWPESYKLLPEWRKGIWEVDIEIRLTPVILRNHFSPDNIKLDTYAIGEEIDYVWTRAKDENGDPILEQTKDGRLMPKLVKRQVKNFIPVLWLTPFIKVED